MGIPSHISMGFASHYFRGLVTGRLMSVDHLLGVATMCVN